MNLTRQCNGPDKEDQQDCVGKRGREVDDLARALDPLDETAEDDDPRRQQTQGQLPLDWAHLLKTAGFVQHLLGQIFGGGCETILNQVIVLTKKYGLC